MLEDYIRYPIGLQNFEQIRTLGCVYVDKTELVYRLTHTDRVYFLSRPRRFGKSLQYALPYEADGRKVVKVGVNFDSETRTIGEWKIIHIFADENKK